MRTAATVLLVVAATLGMPGRSPRAEIVDRVVAVIEDDAIFFSELQRRVRPFERELAQITNAREHAAARERLYRERLEEMVDDALIRRAAQRSYVTVTAADVDRMVEGMARERNARAEDMWNAVEAEGITRAEYRTFIEARVLRLRLMNVRVRGHVNITDADVAEEYRRRVRSALDHAPFHAAHVFVAFPDQPTGTQITEAQRRAEAIAMQARQGADFGPLAHEQSDDASTREHGGDLGWIEPGDPDAAAPEWLVVSLRDLQPGQTSGAIRGENGYHVFRLIERRAMDLPPLANVRDELHGALMQQSMARLERQYLRELRQRTAVEIRL